MIHSIDGCLVISGVRTLPLFAPSNTFQHLIAIFYRRSNDWLTVFRGFLRFLEGSKTSPIRRTGEQKPAEFQRVLSVFMEGVVLNLRSYFSLTYSLKNIDD